MKKTSPYLVLVFLMVACFTLATCIQVRRDRWSARAELQPASILKILFGDGRRLFANHFYTKADVYFHSGYYPTFFDQGAKPVVDPKHLTEEHHAGESDHDEEEHEKAMDFLGKPRDWIDAFGRHFYPVTHSHLDKPGEAREILPWLKLSAELDPGQVNTYTVAAFWLRRELGKPDEAEEFLREGLRENPKSYEILVELGRLYYENRHDPARARNLWELALRRWREQQAEGVKPDEGLHLQMLINLANLEETDGNFAKALEYRELELKITPQPEIVAKEIEELKQKAAPPAKSVKPGN